MAPGPTISVATHNTEDPNPDFCNSSQSGDHPFGIISLSLACIKVVVRRGELHPARPLFGYREVR